MRTVPSRNGDTATGTPQTPSPPRAVPRIDIQFSNHDVPGLGRLSFATDASDEDEFIDSLRAGYSLDPEVTYSMESLSPDRQFIDVGANLGRFTLPIAKRGHRTLAIEALPKNFVLLSKAIQRTGITTAVPVHAAASDFAGLALMEGTSAFASMSDTGTEVPSLTVDELASVYGFERPGIVKIDVEGGERKVLRGMRRLLELPDIEVIIECNTWTCRAKRYSGPELLDDLFQEGFHLYLFHERALVPRQPSDFQEACVSNYLATRRMLEGRVGSFTVRPLALEESLSLIQVQMASGAPHRLHLATSLRIAPRQVLDHAITQKIIAQLLEGNDPLVREALAWRK